MKKKTDGIPLLCKPGEHNFFVACHKGGKQKIVCSKCGQARMV